MSKYNIFMLAVNTTPMPELSKEEADAIVEYISDATHTAFNAHFGERTWGGQSLLNVIEGGLSYLYLVFPEKGTIDEMQRLIVLEVLPIVNKKQTITFSSIDYMCGADNLNEAMVKVDTITNALFNDIINVH